MQALSCLLCMAPTLRVTNRPDTSSGPQTVTSYQVTIAQTIVFHLQTGIISIENNIDKIFEYLRIMTNHKVMSMVIPPVALRRLLLKIEDRMHTNPQLRLSYDP